MGTQILRTRAGSGAFGGGIITRIPMPGPSPERIGKYKILSLIGRGGFGSVYLGFDPLVSRKVAIKVLDNSGPEVAERFRLEARATGSLHHPNIVTVFDSGEFDGLPYLVMEFLEGDSLQQIINERRPLSLLARVKLMQQVGEALSYAHEHRVLHRDVKPGNIIVSSDGHVTIMDFGIARLAADDTRITQTGFVPGTLAYMAPEQLSGHDASVQADVFAFGVVFYELLAGKNPFHGGDTAKVLYRILNVEPEPVTAIVPECPAELNSLILHALAKDPSARYQSFREVLFDLAPTLIELNRESARRLVARAEGFQREGDHASELAQILEALRADPSNPDARQMLRELREIPAGPFVTEALARASVLMSDDRFQEASEVLSATLQRAPGDEQLLSLLDRVRAALGAQRKSMQPDRTQGQEIGRAHV